MFIELFLFLLKTFEIPYVQYTTVMFKKFGILSLCSIRSKHSSLVLIGLILVCGKLRNNENEFQTGNIFKCQKEPYLLVRVS